MNRKERLEMKRFLFKMLYFCLNGLFPYHIERNCIYINHLIIIRVMAQHLFRLDKILR